MTGIYITLGVVAYLAGAWFVAREVLLDEGGRADEWGDVVWAFGFMGLLSGMATIPFYLIRWPIRRISLKTGDTGKLIAKLFKLRKM